MYRVDSVTFFQYIRIMKNTLIRSIAILFFTTITTFSISHFSSAAINSTTSDQNQVSSQVLSNYTVATTESTVSPSSNITIQYTAPADHSSRDWVGIFAQNSPNTAFTEWAYVGSTSGTVVLQVPNTAGTYIVRYLLNDGFTSVAQSNPIMVGYTTTNYSVQTPVAQITPRSSFEIQWSAPQSDNLSRDWVGIFAVGTANTQFLEWAYAGSAQGHVTLHAPENLGTYEIRYLKNDGFDSVAKSSTFTVTPTGTDTGTTTPPTNTYAVKITDSSQASKQISVSWQSPPSENITRDWIGIFIPGQPNTNFYNWSYVSSRSGSLTLQLPPQAGVYEVRYLKNDGFTDVAKSSTVLVSDVVNYPSNGQTIIALGDSLTAGVGASQGNDLVTMLSKKIGKPIINAGISGDTTADALARLQNYVLSKNPKVVMVFLGGNDLLQQVSPTQTFQNLSTIVKKVQQQGAVVLLVGIRGGVFSYNYLNDYRSLAATTHSAFVPDVLDEILGRPNLTSDPVHPNDAGYKIIADRIAPVLKALIQ